MMQGVLTNIRVRLLFKDGMPNYTMKRKGVRKRKSVRGCIVDSQLRYYFFISASGFNFAESIWILLVVPRVSMACFPRFLFIGFSSFDVSSYDRIKNYINVFMPYFTV